MLGKRYLAAATIAAATAAMVAAAPLSALPASASGMDMGMGELTVSPSVLTETDDGGVSITIVGNGLPPLMGYVLHSAGLQAACTGGESLTGQTVTADFDGNFNAQAGGLGCAPSWYCVVASETSSPYQSIVSCFNVIDPPAPVPPVPPGPPSSLPAGAQADPIPVQPVT